MQTNKILSQVILPTDRELFASQTPDRDLLGFDSDGAFIHEKMAWQWQGFLLAKVAVFDAMYSQAPTPTQREFEAYARRMTHNAFDVFFAPSDDPDSTYADVSAEDAYTGFKLGVRVFTHESPQLFDSWRVAFAQLCHVSEYDWAKVNDALQDFSAVVAEYRPPYSRWIDPMIYETSDAPCNTQQICDVLDEQMMAAFEQWFDAVLHDGFLRDMRDAKIQVYTAWQYGAFENPTTNQLFTAWKYGKGLAD